MKPPTAKERGYTGPFSTTAERHSFTTALAVGIALGQQRYGLVAVCAYLIGEDNTLSAEIEYESQYAIPALLLGIHIGHRISTGDGQ